MSDVETWQDAFDLLVQEKAEEEAVVAIQAASELASSTAKPRVALTFKEVQTRSLLLQEALRSFLRSSGGRRWEEQGVLIGLALRRVDPDFLPFLLACCRQGCTFAVTSIDLSDKAKEQDRRSFVFALPPELFIFDELRVPGVPEEIARFSTGGNVLSTEAVPFGRLKCIADDPGLTFDSSRTLPEITKETVFSLMFTGGTTRTKVVQGKHSMILHERKTYPQVIPIQNIEPRVLQNSSCFWPAAVLGQLSMSLAYEACSIITETAEAPELKRQMLLERVSVFGAVPDMLSLLAPENAQDFPHVRAVYSWAERLPRHVALKWRIHPNLILRELLISTEYWLTFVSDPLADWTMNDGSENLITGGAVVRPVCNDVEVLILDVEKGERVEVGGIGELCLRGANVTSGYFLEAENVDAFLTFEGRSYFRTKDLAKLLPNNNHNSNNIGGILFMGRADFQTKEKGQWVDLTSVERILQDHEGVREAAIVQHPHEPTQFHAFVVFQNHRDCWHHLAAIRLMLPSTLGLHVVQELPRKGGTGKVEPDRLRVRLAPAREPSWPFEKGIAPDYLWERRQSRLDPAARRTATLALLSVACWDLKGTLKRGHPGVKHCLTLVTVALAYFPILQLGQHRPRAMMLSDMWRQVPFGTFGPLIFLHALSSFSWGRKAHYLVAMWGALLALRASKHRLLAWPMVFWLGCGNQAATECNSWLLADTWWSWLGFSLPALEDYLIWKLWGLWSTVQRTVCCSFDTLDKFYDFLEGLPRCLGRLLQRSLHRAGPGHSPDGLTEGDEEAEAASGLQDQSDRGLGTSAARTTSAATSGEDGLASIWSSFDQCKAQTATDRLSKVEADLIARAQWIVEKIRKSKDDWPASSWQGADFQEVCHEEPSYEEEMGEADNKDFNDNNDESTSDQPGNWATKDKQETQSYDPWWRWKARGQAEAEGKPWTTGQTGFGYDPENPSECPRINSEQWQQEVVEECYDMTDEGFQRAAKSFPQPEQRQQQQTQEDVTPVRLSDVERRACQVLVRLQPHLDPVSPSTVLLGMDSLRLTLLSGALRTELKKELSTQVLRGVNTVQQLFDLLKSAPEVDEDEEVADQPKNARRLYQTWFSPGQYQTMGPWVFRSDEAVDHDAMERAVGRLVDRHPALRARPADTQAYRSFLLNASHLHLLMRHDLLSETWKRRLGWALLKSWPRIEVCSRDEIHNNIPYQVVRMNGGQCDIENGISDSRRSCEQQPPFLATVLDVNMPLLGAWEGEDPENWDPLVIFRDENGQVLVVETEAWKAGVVLLPDDPCWPQPAPPHFPAFYAAVLQETLPSSTGSNTNLNSSDSSNNPRDNNNNNSNNNNNNDDDNDNNNASGNDSGNDNSNNTNNNDDNDNNNASGNDRGTDSGNDDDNNNNDGNTNRNTNITNSNNTNTNGEGLNMGTTTAGGSSSSSKRGGSRGKETTEVWLRLEDSERLIVYRRKKQAGRCDPVTSMQRYTRRSPPPTETSHGNPEHSLKVSILVLRCFHFVSDGMSLQPLISDLLDLYSAEKCGKGSELKLPSLPDGFEILEQRLKAALMGDLLDPTRHSLRCSYWNHRRAGYSHDIRIQGNLVMALRTVAQRLLIPMDYLMLSLLMIAMARASNAESVELILYVPMRDGQESSIPGLFADWREVFLPMEKAHATLVGTALLLEQTLRQRHWRVFNPLKKPEMPVVNFDTNRSRRQQSFLQLPNTIWDPTLNYPLGRRPTRSDKGDEEIINQPINFDINEEQPDLWRIHSRLAFSTHPPSWGQTFVAELKHAAIEMILYPMRHVHRALPQSRAYSN